MFIVQDGDAFATEPHRNMTEKSLGFYHVQAISVVVNKPFLEYIRFWNDRFQLSVFLYVSQ